MFISICKIQACPFCLWSLSAGHPLQFDDTGFQVYNNVAEWLMWHILLWSTIPFCIHEESLSPQSCHPSRLSKNIGKYRSHSHNPEGLTTKKTLYSDPWSFMPDSLTPSNRIPASLHCQRSDWFVWSESFCSPIRRSPFLYLSCSSTSVTHTLLSLDGLMFLAVTDTSKHPTSFVRYLKDWPSVRY